MSKKPANMKLLGYEAPVYIKEDGGEINTGIKLTEYKLSGSITSAKKKILTSPPARFFTAISKLIAYTGTRAYGTLLLSYGLLTIIVELAKEYFNISSVGVNSSIIIGSVLALISIPFFLIDKPLCIALQDISFTDFVFFEFFSIKRMHRQQARGIPALVMVVFGIIFAILGAVFGVAEILLSAVCIAVLYLSFVSPEFAFFSTIIVLPMSSLIPYGALIIGCMIGASFISFMRKVVFGKRVYSIEIYDLLLLGFILCVLVSGIFTKDAESFESSLTMVVFALVYTLASNLISNRRLAESALNASVISSLFTVSYTLYEVIPLVISDGLSAIYTYSAAAAFENAETLASFLLIVLVILAYFIYTTKRSVLKFLYAVAFIANLLCLVLTRRVEAVFALAAGFLIYLALKSKLRFAPVSAVLLLLPLLLFVLPSEYFDLVMNSIGSGYTKTEYVSLWSNSFELFKKNIFFGVGIGSESFSSALSDYGIVSENSSNFFMEIGCEVGAIGLVFLLLIIISRLFHRSVYRGYVSDSQVASVANATIAMTCVLLAFGMTNYIWSGYAGCFMFWYVFGIGSAALRMSKREHDDRVIYYGDITTADSSVIDIKIR